MDTTFSKTVLNITLQCGGIEKLIKKRKSAPVYYVTIEDTYDIIKRAQIATGHGGPDRMKCNLGSNCPLDMQSLPQAQFKWIMVYQYHPTKFVILWALTSNRAAEVAFQLPDIFLLFGAPAILQSDNGSEFTAKSQS
ncbi:KRAB-A domain-containing protein 2-like [Penaeus chinensis]|uniref:KRAB-A domain-containing protein 2-like n=1 Tax=Penaeus chinensis TaxID=139456 RepID=UPI001FB74AC2|nr:KRAB-A domain-containing protein 2-like [Penaeus chinensis]